MAAPKLRFKDSGGREFPEWENNRLGSLVGKISSGKDEPSDGDFILYGSTGIIGKCEHPTYKGRKILIARVGANAGLANLVNEDCGVSDNTLIVKDSVSCILDWLFFSLIQKNLGKMRFGSGQPLVTGTMLYNLELKVPSLPEQQKIANFLTAYDTMIDTQTKRVEAMKLRKKGLLQKIFSQEIRFKDTEGKEFPEWEERKLGEVCELLNGRAYSQPELLANGKYRVLRVGNFFTNGNWYYSDMELEAQKYAVTGDLLYAWAASLGPKIWDEEKVIYHYHIWKVVPYNGVSKMFLYHFLDNETKLLIRDMNGGTMKHITKAEMEKRNVQLPSLPEQQKIADFLTDVDKQLEVEEKRLETMKTIKKGLLQQMFV